MAKKFTPVMQSAMTHYAQLSDDLNKAESPYLTALRQSAKAQFLEQGFPTRRDEDWGYTKLTDFVQTHFRLQGISHLTQADILPFLPSFGATRIVLVDGWFSESLSDDLSALPKGVTIESFEDLQQVPESAVQLQAHQQDVAQEPFAVMNTMLLNDGVVIQIDKHAVLEMPLFVLHVQTQPNHLSNLRNRITVGEYADVTLVEAYVSLSDDLCALTNVVSEIDIASHARVKQVVLQQQNKQSYYFNNQFVYQAEHSGFNTLYAGLGCVTSRHQNHVYMNGEHIETIQNSACYATGAQTVDSRSYTEHNQEHGFSQQLHKYVLDGEAVGVFNGMIKVARAAQKTDGQMDNKNLLLSDSAQMDTKPQLEIYADDVKCSHGSATGQINKEQIFYLQARGIPRPQAVRMITEAFLLEPVEVVSHGAIREWVAQILSQTLRG
ncbi:Fe-S cluster assembly protein SufD [Thiomicrorhabdus cannonii]|uniref:Fe-S cluster assembly protein SufD n=1 Tax=Thiomicrorhabdus cannonii TaxID=2748011 RepID=UPI001FED1BC9|nr:Fe-S cluster assembly protein SufD [Thiomicrorhabdus cannonii]